MGTLNKELNLLLKTKGKRLEDGGVEESEEILIAIGEWYRKLGKQRKSSSV